MSAREQASKTGELPHEFLLRVSRGEAIGEHAPTFSERTDAAKAAAPYFAPRLACAQLDLNQGGSPDWLQPPEGADPHYMTNGQLMAAIINGVARDRESWNGFCSDAAVERAITDFIERDHMPLLKQRIATAKAAE